MSSALLLALLLAQAAPRTAAAQAQAAAEAAQKSADATAATLEQGLAALQKAAEAAQAAASAAQKAAEAAEKSAEAVEKSVAKPAAPAEAAAVAVPAATAAAPATPPVIWTGSLNVGIIALTGNSQTLTFAGGGAFQRKSEAWIWALKFAGAYGQTTAADSTVSQVTALNGLAEARGDKRFTDQLSLYLLTGIDTDHLKSIEERPYGELGVSLIWWDDKIGDLQKSTLKTDLGFRYGHEFRQAYYPTAGRVDGVDIVAPRVGLAFRYALNKEVIFNDEFQVLGNLVGQTRLLLTNTAKLNARLTEKVSLGIGFAVNDDSEPPAGKVSVDTALTVGLEVAL